MIYLISYDLRKPGRNYGALYDGIKSLGNWVHPLESVWVVSSQYSAVQIRDHLGKFVDGGDAVVVIEQTKNGAWFGLHPVASEALKRALDTQTL